MWAVLNHFHWLALLDGALLFYRHTAIVVHGKEFFFVGEGINNCPPVRVGIILFLKHKAHNLQSRWFTGNRNHSWRNGWRSACLGVLQVVVLRCLCALNLRPARLWVSPTPRWTWAPLRCPKTSSWSTCSPWRSPRTGVCSGSSHRSTSPAGPSRRLVQKVLYCLPTIF